MIKAIIFDLWETLGTKNVGISKMLMHQFNIEKTPDFMTRYESSIQLSAWKSEDEMSSSFLRSFNLLNTRENLGFVTATLRSGVEKSTLYDGMGGLLRELKAMYKLGILSNTTVFESQAPKKWGVDGLFDTQVYSWQIKSLKPAKRNFDEICARLNVAPSECMFIDDGEKNIIAARSYGFSAIKYESVAQLRTELNRLGVNAHD